MKKLFFIFLLAAATSCTKSYLNTKPSDQLSDATFWQTDADALAGITAIYDQMQHNYQIYAFMPETDGITPNGWIWSGYKNGYAAIAEGNLLPTTATPVSDKWGQLYNGIYKSNLAISKIPGINMDATLKTRLLAEAGFLRALFYYNLVDFYGGVPLVREILQLGAPLPGRNTKQEVLAYVTSECDRVAKDLPVSYGASDIGRATRGAAFTLKARAYLLNNQFQEAADAAKQVMDLGQYQLYADYAGMFTNVAAENNKEVIFDVQYAAPGLGEGSPLDGLMAPLSSYSKGWDQIFPTQDLVDAYEMTNGLPITDPTSGYDPAHPYDNRDPRMDYTLVRPGATWRNIPYSSLQIGTSASSYTGYLPRKHVLTVDGFNWGDSPLNFIVFRYADVLLMYAEAKNEAGGPDATVYDALNQIRARVGVGMPPITQGKTQDELRQIIRHERRVEMAFEGTYYSDIRRWGIAKQLMDGKVIRNIAGQQLDVWHFTDALYLWPIPQSEMDLNSKLSQNQGYN
ncbi:MAG TPA: RagB/SusD family nutrient uptake outer membrane protein [Puia sp.]|nr:RagB/SusD family nutrient uptake outer membrane protein [Puia sp.]